MNKLFVVKIWSILLLFLVLAIAIACGGGGSGGGGGGGGAPAAYTAKVESYKADHGKSDEWSAWMVENHARYTYAFAASEAKPDTITISYRYDTDPESTFTTDWVDEADHMTAFAVMAEGAYPGYNFNFEFEGNTTTSACSISG